jgi:hypothetical protein
MRDIDTKCTLRYLHDAEHVSEGDEFIRHTGTEMNRLKENDRISRGASINVTLLFNIFLQYFAKLAPISTEYFALGQDSLVDEVREVAPNIMPMNIYKGFFCKGSHVTCYIC